MTSNQTDTSLSHRPAWEQTQGPEHLAKLESLVTAGSACRSILERAYWNFLKRGHGQTPWAKISPFHHQAGPNISVIQGAADELCAGTGISDADKQDIVTLMLELGYWGAGIGSHQVSLPMDGQPRISEADSTALRARVLNYSAQDLFNVGVFLHACLACGVQESARPQLMGLAVTMGPATP